MILDDFFDAVAAFDAEAFSSASCIPTRASARCRTRSTPRARERDSVEAREAFERGKDVLRGQRYDVHDVIATGDKIAAGDVDGTLAATAGAEGAHRDVQRGA